MKKFLKPAIITIILLGALTVGAYMYLTGGSSVTGELEERMRQEQADCSEIHAYSYDLDKNSTDLITSGEGKNVLNFDNKNVYDVKTSQAARDRLDRLIKRMNASFKEPIIALNPFGTNPGSFYFYFKMSARGMVRYTITIEDSDMPDFTRYVNSGMENNQSAVQEFVISGIVPGKTNYIIMEVLDVTGAQREEKIYRYDAPAVSGVTNVSFEKGNSKETNQNGLFFVFPKGDSNFYAYDRSGQIRNTTVTEGNHGTRLYQCGNELIYQVADRKFAKVSNIGRVNATCQLPKNLVAKDFAYDGYEHIYTIATDKGADSLFATSMKTGKTKKVYQFPKGISLQSLTQPDQGGIYLAVTKPDGILRLDAITSKKPKVSYVFGPKKDWQKATGWKKKIWENDTISKWNLSGSKLNLESDGSLATYVMNKGTGTGVSFCINAKKKKAEKLETFPVGETGNCTCEKKLGHYIISNGNAGWYGEYDKAGKVTTEYTYGREIDAVFKLTLDGMCFYGAE
ncbi:MAG: aryl-sulfate sulfotransferase N-terminal domain-containing protein [Eubacterium sp.]|nr:aryl-sulfate sulfotransferase N-terminal domain-containing protein [Eubacterium sp.]